MKIASPYKNFRAKTLTVASASKSKTPPVREIKNLEELKEAVESSPIPSFLALGEHWSRPSYQLIGNIEDLSRDPRLANKIQFLKVIESAKDIEEYFKIKSFPTYLSFPAREFQVIENKHISFAIDREKDLLRKRLTDHLIKTTLLYPSGSDAATASHRSFNNSLSQRSKF